MNKPLLLLGAGHAHAVLLREWIAQGYNAGNCCLISESAEQMYSGMVPGWLSGDYRQEDCVIDVASLCARAGVQWIQARITGLNAKERWVHAGGVRYGFENLSINLGAQPKASGSGDIGIKPFQRFVAQVQAWDLAAGAGPLNIAVVGGGLGGLELVMGLAVRYFTTVQPVSVSWFTGPKGPLAGASSGVRAQAVQAIEAVNIQVHERYFAQGDAAAFNGVIWATQASAADWLRLSGLQLDEHGFIVVDEFFRCLNHTGVFAAGDICRRQDRSLLPSGVNAVRAGTILAHNIRQLRKGGNCGVFKAYQPRKWLLQIAALGRQRALGMFGPWYWHGHWIWRIKRFIDRRFMESFIKG